MTPPVFAQADWDIYSFHINSTVSSRYATTVITSRVANRMNNSKEIEFHVRIPKNAFISKFRMCVSEKIIVNNNCYHFSIHEKHVYMNTDFHSVSLQAHRRTILRRRCERQRESAAAVH